MSFVCVLGMHEVGWEADRYTVVEKNAKLARTTKETSSNVTANGYDLSNANGVNGEVASYLFERQGVATSFTKSVTMDENTFAGKHWAVNDKTETVSPYFHSTKMPHIYARVLFVVESICSSDPLIASKYVARKLLLNEHTIH
jgi:hypothetical protein